MRSSRLIMSYGLLLLSLCLTCSVALAQERVKGYVRDRQGNPLSNVTVMEKGGKNGIMTKDNGSFEFTVSGSGKTLVFSSVGYVDKQQNVPSSGEMSIIMEEDAYSLDETVVVGYQDVQRRKMTGAVSTVKGKDFENTPYATFDAMLQGRVAGLTVLSTSGEPGTNNIVNIRGSSNLGLADNQLQAPLYVIDGIIYDVSDIQAAYGNSSPL